MGLEQFDEGYKARVVAGQREIGAYFNRLLPETRDWLVTTGLYTQSGGRGPLEDSNDALVLLLEYCVGVIFLCTNANIPSRYAETDKPMPQEAVDDEVLGVCNQLLGTPAWHDPLILRWALYAIARREVALLSTQGLPAKGARAFWQGTRNLFGGLLFLATPVSLAYGFVAVSEHDARVAAVWFIMAMFGLDRAVLHARGIEPGSLPADRAYLAWHDIAVRRKVGVTGGAICTQLELLLKSNIPVPTEALDLAHLLRGKSGST